MRWTVSNILTILRLLAAPAVLVVFLILPRPAADWAAFLLFVGAAVTDWFDGHLARIWKQQTRLGTMLDPVADKAIVIIALAAITGLTGLDALIILPTAVILFRETFVSGLREFLGDTAGTLKVTRLAKWKTTVQMVAISLLFVSGAFAHQETATEADGWTVAMFGYYATWYLGVILLWAAAVLTFLTGLDYFNKARPYLKD